jgi:uncharacterized membrane protein YkoI
MEHSMLDRRALLLAGVGFFVSPAARAEDEDDHDQARRALKRGEIRPLTDIMAQLQGQLGGEVIEVSFKNKRGGRTYAYEFTVLTPSGRISEVLVDAATAKILEREDD